MDYRVLAKEDFDAIVTGELTHCALWLEEELNSIITDYFVRDDVKRQRFKQLLLYRDGLTFQDKIEIVRGMLPFFGSSAKEMDLKSLLREIEQFKSWRNALAHGLDVSLDEETPHIMIEAITRSGRQKTVEIKPENHERLLKKTEDLLAKVQNARKKLNA